mmetsp:Transcript_31821/g.54280  ORF Transcript_31821/g.54280 Transcript_31821/m.54280 type:complete len:108 (-) Transcript_31821:363-686(-)
MWIWRTVVVVVRNWYPSGDYHIRKVWVVICRILFGCMVQSECMKYGCYIILDVLRGRELWILVLEKKEKSHPGQKCGYKKCKCPVDSCAFVVSPEENSSYMGLCTNF